MRLHRFIGEFDLSTGRVHTNDGPLLEQVRSVLRLAPGDECILCDGKGHEARVQIDVLEKRELIAQVVERRPCVPELVAPVTLYCAVLKRDNFEWVVQKATEVGVRTIVPVITSRTVKLGVNTARLSAIAREAAEQCGRGIVPVVEEPVLFVQAVDRAAQSGQAVVYCEQRSEPTNVKIASTGVTVFIGPEGGWEEPEMDAMREAGAVAISLGSTTLRAETAAVVAVYWCAQRMSAA